MSDATRYDGALRSGSRYVLEAPGEWNGVLLLYSKPVPVAPGEPPWQPEEPLIRQLVGNGYAVAGHANTIFWPVEGAFANGPPLLDIAARELGAARHTIAFGLSIGGLITAGLVQRFPDRFSGALPMCGNLGGAIANQNRELDIAFAVKTLIAPDSALELVRITDPHANLALATRILHEAQGTPAGRARLALAAAMGNIPGWQDPCSAQPASHDFEGRQRGQFDLFAEVGFLVFFMTRFQVERQAGGNPSWNTGVDYAELLATSVNRDEVEWLYQAADLNLQDDLERLASEPRITSDPHAAAYLERHIVFNGELHDVPVLTMHTDGDGLVIPANERSYAEIVDHAGSGSLLRQLFVHRGGHCTFSFAEILTALDALIARIETRAWPDLAPKLLNEAAARMGPDANVSAMGDGPMSAGFFDFAPPALARQYDGRDLLSGPTRKSGPEASK